MHIALEQLFLFHITIIIHHKLFLELFRATFFLSNSAKLFRDFPGFSEMLHKWSMIHLYFHSTVSFTPVNCHNSFIFPSMKFDSACFSSSSRIFSHRVISSFIVSLSKIPISQSGDLFFFLLLESQMIMLLNAVFPCPENHQIQQYQEGQYAQQQHHSYFWFFLEPIFFCHRH